MFGIIRFFLKRALAYRAEVIPSLISHPIELILLYFVWNAIYSTQQSIGDFTFHILIMYYIAAKITEVLVDDNVGHDIGILIRDGDFSPHLLKPIPFFFYQLYNKIGNRMIALVLQVIPLIVVFTLLFYPYIIAGNVYLFLLSLLCAFYIRFTLGFIIGTLAFWFVNIRSFNWLIMFFVALVSGTAIPLSFFPDAFYTFLLFTPFAYIIYVPVSIYLEHISAYYIIGQMIWMILLSIASYILYNMAISRYEGVGQ
ncbi:MAG: ABC transporter permease [Candidatus Woesearchaeota archaeon]